MAANDLKSIVDTITVKFLAMVYLTNSLEAYLSCTPFFLLLFPLGTHAERDRSFIVVRQKLARNILYKT